MALTSTLYRFHIELSDIDRGVYQALDLRIAMHPSETAHFLLTRVLAYALNWQEDLEFSPGGLSDPDAPGIKGPGRHGNIGLWIEIGSPSARKMNKASKASEKLKIYTYKNPETLLREMASENIYQAHLIEIFSFTSDFLDLLAAQLQRDNKWSLIHTDSSLSVNVGEISVQGEVHRHSH